MKKRIISLVLAVMMLTTLVPTFVFAAEETESNIITLVDFGNPANIKTNNECYGPSALAYEGKDSSFRFTMSAVDNGEGTLISETGDYNIIINDDSRDLSAYKDSGTINIRFYSEAAGSKINFNFYNTAKGFSGNNLNQQVTINGGWQVHFVKLSDVYAKTANTITFRINDDGWDNMSKGGYNDGDTVYIDSVYIDTNPNSYYKNLGEDTLTIWDAVTYPVGTAAYSNTREGGLSKYSTFSGKSTTKQFRVNMTTDEVKNQYYTTVFNTGDYNWVNMWVYSPRAQDDGFNFALYTNKRNDNDTDGDGVTKEADDSAYIDGVKQTANANTYPLMYSVKQVNWEGWKLISIPLPSGAQNKNIISCEFNIGGWTGNYTNCPDTNNLEIGFEGIWLSKGETSPQAEWETANPIGTDAAITPAASDIVLKDYSTDEVSGSNAAEARGNGRLYDRVARISFESISEAQLWEVANNSADSKVPGTAKGSLTVYGSGSNSTEIITGLSDDAYINAWIYNPEPKYSYDSTTSAELILALGYWNGTTTKLTPIHIIADWTGWKLVSVPVKDANSNLISKGINYVYFAPNSGWYPVTKASAGTAAVSVITRTAEQKAQGYIINGSSNVFGKAASTPKNLYNYIDVERVWISQGKPEAEAAVNYADLSALVCSENTDVSLFAADSAIGKASIGAVSNLDMSAAAEAVTLSEGTAGFDTLKNGAQYSVYVSDIYNTNGVKLPDTEYIFNVENYHVAKTEENGSITAEMHGNVPEEYTAGVMVAAVYNKATKALEDVEFAQVAEGKVTASVEGFDEATQDIKFIFISGWTDLKPLKTEIVE
ncbi:MAG: hypothetical protein IJ460_08155 [Clostridia bacterium]|nr:hypothetical protein [Clostridia bacterium]